MKPFIQINNEIIPIFNLHIHCKNLNKFINVKMFDIVIPLGPGEMSKIHKQIEYTKKNVFGYRNIYLVSYDPTINLDGCITIDEKSFCIRKDFIENYFAEYNGKNNRNGWYLQQLLKFYSGECIPGILDDYLIIDADVFFLKPIKLIDNDGKYLFNVGDEHHLPYFRHMAKMNENLIKMNNTSGICHHMIFNKMYIRELFELVEKTHNKAFWEIFIEMIDEHKNHDVNCSESGASEYEIYYNFMIKYKSDKIKIRELKWDNVSYNEDLNNYNQDCDLHYISVCSWWT
jgi:hypothetical protein